MHPCSAYTNSRPRIQISYNRSHCSSVVVNDQTRNDKDTVILGGFPVGVEVYSSRMDYNQADIDKIKKSPYIMT